MLTATELLTELTKMTLGASEAPRNEWVRIVEEPTGEKNWSSTPSRLRPDLFVGWNRAIDCLETEYPVVDWSGVGTTLADGRRFVLAELTTMSRAA